MYLLVSLIIVSFLSLVFEKQIKLKKNLLFFISAIISLLVSIYEIIKISTGFKLSGFPFVIERSFMKGFISLSFFILVMFAGALNKRFEITKRLLRIRAELAIIASILLLPHGIIYLYKFLIAFINKPNLSLSYISLIVIGLIAFIIMIPLFITSFDKYRKSLGYKKWKSIQRFSYLFFFLTYVHIMVILLFSEKIDIFSLALYNLIFLSYTFLRLRLKQN
ncbi:ferric reductase-like transmembrane domain-containing protein [Clostridium chrysemydis]|uniref:ferric reductase-like transmembrane domain-containing protein n=1 Tax=Clostridium chrysemydis TaxID=2665504 RepID=UPI001A9BE304|nr:ferric reductase-like transmembrane domain-containing protein [Clostridium chrysemydis]